MNDSQSTDYLQIVNSLLSSRQQWQQIPEIVNLSLKAIVRELQSHQQSFLEHKTLINEQSLKIKQLQLKLGNKISKKDLQGEVLSILNSKSSSPRQLEDSLSQYEKLIKQSRYQRERGVPTVQQLKTIAEIIADKRLQTMNDEIRNKLLNNKLQIEQKISNLKEDIKSRMIDFQKQRRQWVSECRQAHSRLEQSALRASHSQAEDKIGHLQHSNKRMSQGLSHLITHLQQNFLTKQEVNLLMERQKEKERQKQRKSPPKIKERQAQKSKKKDQQQLQKFVQHSFRKMKAEQQKQWLQFKQNVNKEIGLLVNIDTVNNIVDNLQKSMQQQYQKINLSLNKLQQRYISNMKSQEISKEALVKSEKRAQKRSSPSKAIESIQSSLSRLQKNIVEKQHFELKKMDEEVDSRIKNYDSKLMQELDRRQKHLCEVIEQTYNQATKSHEAASYKQALKRLNDSNLHAKYLYFGTKQCKKQSCVPWEKETLNSLVENFVWKKDSMFVLINAAGLYKVEVGLFGNITTQSTLLLNGDPFAIIPPPQSNRNTGIKIRGAIFSQFLLLPAKAKLSVRVQQHFYGQAFLFLQLV